MGVEFRRVDCYPDGVKETMPSLLVARIFIIVLLALIAVFGRDAGIVAP